MTSGISTTLYECYNREFWVCFEQVLMDFISLRYAMGVKNNEGVAVECIYMRSRMGEKYEVEGSLWATKNRKSGSFVQE